VRIIPVGCRVGEDVGKRLGLPLGFESARRSLPLMSASLAEILAGRARDTPLMRPLSHNRRTHVHFGQNVTRVRHRAAAWRRTSRPGQRMVMIADQPHEFLLAWFGIASPWRDRRADPPEWKAETLLHPQRRGHRPG